MTSPHCRGAEKIFDQRTAERDLEAYRAHGLGTTTRLLIAALKAVGVTDRTLLDISGGVGATQHELLKDGARSAIAIDASSAYLHAARHAGKLYGVVFPRDTWWMRLGGRFVNLFPRGFAHAR